MTTAVVSSAPPQLNLHVNVEALHGSALVRDYYAGAPALAPFFAGCPWDAQAWSLNFLTEARNEAAQVEKTARIYLQGNPNRDQVLRQLADIDQRIRRTQRLIANPVTCRFVIRPAE